MLYANIDLGGEIWLRVESEDSRTADRFVIYVASIRGRPYCTIGKNGEPVLFGSETMDRNLLDYLYFPGLADAISSELSGFPELQRSALDIYGNLAALQRRQNLAVSK